MPTANELPLVQINWDGVTPQAVPDIERITGQSPWSYLLSPQVRFFVDLGGVPPQTVPDIERITGHSPWSQILSQYICFIDEDERITAQTVLQVRIALDRDHRLMKGRRFSAINFNGSARPFVMGQLTILVSPRAQGAKFWVNLFSQVRTWCERAVKNGLNDTKTIFNPN